MNLNEAKQVGTIYHFTVIEKLQYILLFEELQSGEFPGISFTRNKDLWYEDSNIRLVFDGTKISNNYKIKPYLFWGAGDVEDISDLSSRELKAKNIEFTIVRNRFGKEAEEKVYADKLPLSPYLMYIDIDDGALNEASMGYNFIEIMRKYPQYEYRGVLENSNKTEELTPEKAEQIYWENMGA